MCQDLLMFYSVNQRCYLTQSSIRNFYHFDDTKDNQRFFLIARPPRVVLKKICCCCMFSSSYPVLLSPFLPWVPNTHTNTLLCVLLLHLCSDYSSIDSHADVAIGRLADLALDTHNKGSCGIQITGQGFLSIHTK